MIQIVVHNQQDNKSYTQAIKERVDIEAGYIRWTTLLITIVRVTGQDMLVSYPSRTLSKTFWNGRFLLLTESTESIHLSINCSSPIFVSSLYNVVSLWKQQKALWELHTDIMSKGNNEDMVLNNCTQPHNCDWKVFGWIICIFWAALCKCCEAMGGDLPK